MAQIYPDSKTFVDKKLKHSPGKIIKKFEELVKNNNGQSLSKEQIKGVGKKLNSIPILAGILQS